MHPIPIGCGTKVLTPARSAAPGFPHFLAKTLMKQDKIGHTTNPPWPSVSLSIQCDLSNCLKGIGEFITNSAPFSFSTMRGMVSFPSLFLADVDPQEVGGSLLPAPSKLDEGKGILPLSIHTEGQNARVSSVLHGQICHRVEPGRE